MYDPQADTDYVVDCYGFGLVDDITDAAPYEAIVVAVRHEVFATTLSVQVLREIAVDESPILVDVKSLYDREAACLAGFDYWRL